MPAVPNDAPRELPPMLKLYVEYKQKHPDCILFMQVGDFFELFFDDAPIVANTLNLTLTSRDKNSENPIPMCGVPVAVVDGYVDRLVDLGHSVAVVKQVGMAAPKNGAKKGMVERALDRIVTPSVRLLSGVNGHSSSPALLTVVPISAHEYGIAYSQVDSGIVEVLEVSSFDELYIEVKRVGPAEIVLPVAVGQNKGEAKVDRRLSWVRSLELLVGQSCLKFRHFDSLDSYASSKRDAQMIDGFLALSHSTKQATRLLTQYLDETTGELTVSINTVKAAKVSGVVRIDANTKEHLELLKNTKTGTTVGTLLSVLDETCSPGGARLLRNWILNPLTDKAAIEKRYEVVSFIKQNIESQSELRKRLGALVDFERIAARIELRAVTPRELAALRDALMQTASLQRFVSTLNSPELLQELALKLDIPEQLVSILQERLLDAPALTLLEGGVIKDGFNEDVDRFRYLKQEGRGLIAKVEAREKERTGISSLKIKFNNVFGYFIEITRANLDKVPQDYVRKQTMVNAERFITEELKKLETEVREAETKLVALEQALFDQLRSDLQEYSLKLRSLGRTLSQIDVLQSFAHKAYKQEYVCASLTEGKEILIDEGHHPVLSQMLGREYIPNGVSIEDGKEHCLVLTGANMGGKSTYLRQIGLLTIMAQIGSFLPAKAATIGIVDQIYTRLGASDDMAEGESTFMVEMREASAILKGATARSLVLIDEIGRGTATTDGLAIAKSIFEWLVEKIQCRTIFATHFHELAQLAQSLSAARNVSVGSIEEGNRLLFTHKIVEGPANKSYGLEVAKLAGLPEELLKKAQQALNELESDPVKQQSQSQSSQLSIFSNQTIEVEKIVEPDDYAQLQGLKKELAEVDINNLTPVDALMVLNQLVRGVGSI